MGVQACRCSEVIWCKAAGLGKRCKMWGSGGERLVELRQAAARLQAAGDGTAQRRRARRGACTVAATPPCNARIQLACSRRGER